MSKTKKIVVKGTEIVIIDQDNRDYISLTDMTKGFEDSNSLIEKWLRAKSTLEFLAVWEAQNNVNFNSLDFEGIRKEAGSNIFIMSVKKWIELTDSIGITAKAGRYGGTYAHKDIAYHFGMWLSPEFHLLVIREFDRLKEEESRVKQVGWDVSRYLSRVNYKLQTDSIKDNLVPISSLPTDKQWLLYAEEADILNMAVFGTTAREWRERNGTYALQGMNIRDVANLHQLTVISNLEVINSKLIREGIDKETRFYELRKEALFQLQSLQSTSIYTIDQIQSPFIEEGKLASPPPEYTESSLPEGMTEEDVKEAIEIEEYEARMTEEEQRAMDHDPTDEELRSATPKLPSYKPKGDFDEKMSKLLKVPPPPKRDKKD